MQPIPHRLHAVKRAIQATVEHQLIAAAVGLAVVATATLVFSERMLQRRRRDEQGRKRVQRHAVNERRRHGEPGHTDGDAIRSLDSRHRHGGATRRVDHRLGCQRRAADRGARRGGRRGCNADSCWRVATMRCCAPNWRSAKHRCARRKPSCCRRKTISSAPSACGDSGVYSAEALETRRHNAMAVQAKLELAIAQRRELEVRIAQTRVLAPSAGVVSKKTATVGQVVQPGSELFRLIKDGQLEWMAELPAHSMTQVQPGASVRVRLDGGEPIDGTVRLVAPTLDASTRNGVVHVALPLGTAIKAGTHANGEILTQQVSGIALPEAAVLTRDGYPL